MDELAIFPLTDEHRMIRETARDFAQKEIAPIAAEFDESGEFPYATVQKMGQMGLMGIEVPERYGGAGMDTLSYVLALEEISGAFAALRSSFISIPRKPSPSQIRARMNGQFSPIPPAKINVSKPPSAAANEPTHFFA